MRGIDFKDGSSLYFLTDSGRLFVEINEKNHSRDGEVKDLHQALKILFRELSEHIEPREEPDL